MEESVLSYKELLGKWLNNECTPEEAEKVLLFLQGSGSNRVLLQQLRAEFERERGEGVPAEVSERVRRQLMERTGPQTMGGPYRRMFFWRVAAAVILAVVGTGVYRMLVHHGEASKDIVAHKVETASLPVRPKATITLDNGKRIVLDDSTGGTLVSQRGTKIVKLADGRIAYEPEAAAGVGVSYHTLTVPEGCKPVQVSLADGTEVWVNTASVLRYPAAFTGGKRDVTLRGEAYFEVAQEKDKPFSVQTEHMTVQVLGTAFDVSAYNDDKQHDVVLASGSVVLTANGHSGVLQRQLSPGDLASYVPGTGRLSMAVVNTEEYISWRKGYLIFKRAPLEEIIKRLSRYYNIQIDIKAAGLQEETFSGRLDFIQNIEDIMETICMGTPFVYLPKERKLVLKKAL
ncbi:MAG TPA: FecR domain-containing protein [Puia sp.]|nr:FecR domain-containing protein [Puia sp.]